MTMPASDSKPTQAQATGASAVAQGQDTTALAARALQILGNSSGNNNTGIQYIETLYQQASRDGAGPDELRRAYLAWLCLRANELPLTAGDSGKPIQLASVYTALLTRGPALEAEQELAWKGKEQERNEREESPLSALEALDRSPRLVLKGGPGSGKTTFLNYVALCMAGENLGLEEANLAHLCTPLPPDSPEQDEKPQRWSRPAPLPVRVILRDFAATLPPCGEAVGADALWRFIVGQMPRQLDRHADALQAELMSAGGALILLDGLDEVPGALDEAWSRREQVNRAVQEFAGIYRNCRYLVTTRTYAYQEAKWKLPDFDERELLPFGRGQIERFIDTWYAHLAALFRLGESDALTRAEILKRATRRRELAEMAERPLLLTLMARLQAKEGGTLPENREKLYAQSVDMLLDEWEGMKLRRDPNGQPLQADPSLGEWLHASREDIRRELDKLAYNAHLHQPTLEGSASIRQQDLILALWDAARKRKDVNPLLLEDYLRDRSGLLASHDTGLYQFPHRSFQEYLAACHLVRHDFPDTLSRLARNDPERWREVVLLAAAYANAPTAVWELVDALATEAPPTQGEAAKADQWGGLLAGQVLRETGLARHNPELQPRHEKKRLKTRDWQWHILAGATLPARERALAGDLLVELGDPRFDPERFYLPADDGLGFVHIQADPIFRIGTLTKDKQRIDAYDDELNDQPTPTPDFHIARYPVTVAQYRAFVAAKDYKLGDPKALREPDSRPVRYVAWNEALDYCAWLEERLRERAGPVTDLLRSGDWRLTLPSELEWEKAARGGHVGRAYPWGDQADPERANYADTGIGTTSAVGCFPANDYGLYDMAGNVWEWTRSLWGKDWEKPEFGYPYRWGDAARENLEAGNDMRRVVRGGAWDNPRSCARCALRLGDHPDGRGGLLGFRVVLSPVRRL
jgi:formylglycine-generating enzyme required for sulfatase activity